MKPFKLFLWLRLSSWLSSQLKPKGCLTMENKPMEQDAAKNNIFLVLHYTVFCLLEHCSLRGQTKFRSNGAISAEILVSWMTPSLQSVQGNLRSMNISENTDVKLRLKALEMYCFISLGKAREVKGQELWSPQLRISSVAHWSHTSISTSLLVFIYHYHFITRAFY